MMPKKVLNNILGCERPPKQDKFSKNKNKCDFCEKDAIYDGKTRMGPWGFMCDEHFSQYGVGLGLGKGQVLKDIGGK